ncbi:MAG: hypothetical protein V7607_1700 [Solirubrobacteraceae bacterium]
MSETATFVDQFAAGWRLGSIGPLLEHFEPLLAGDVRLEQPMAPNARGVEAFRRQFTALYRVMPDLTGEVESWSVESDGVTIDLTLTGTLGRKPFSWTARDRVTLRAGRIAARRSTFNPALLLMAIARRPSAWPAALRSLRR